MKLIKNVFGSIDVDADRGVIWVNSFGRCILRICQLQFKNNIENFSSIDCTGKDTIMEKSDTSEESSEFEKFIFDAAEAIYLNGLSEDKEFLCKLLKTIKESTKK